VVSTKTETPTQTSGEVSISQRIWSGPLPDPGDLRAYNEVQEGFAERIMRRFEKQGDHRQELERVEQQQVFRLQRGSQIAATIITLGFGGMATYLIANGNDVSGLIMVGTSILGLVWANRRTQRKLKE